MRTKETKVERFTHRYSPTMGHMDKPYVQTNMRLQKIFPSTVSLNGPSLA